MKEKLWNRNYIKVMMSNFMIYFAFYILTPLLPIYLSEKFGATKDIIGIVLSGYTIAALVIRPLSGYIVDSFSRKKVLILSFFFFFIFFGGYIAAGSIILFAVFRTIHG
nr:MFS transporter [Prevotella sp.]